MLTRCCMAAWALPLVLSCSLAGDGGDGGTGGPQSTPDAGQLPRDGGVLRYDGGVLALSDSGPPQLPDASQPDAARTDASASASASSSGSSAGSSSRPPSSSGPASADAGVTYMYAHTAQALYRVPPATRVPELLGNIDWRDENNTPLPAGEQMTDVAINNAGVMFGVSFGALYRVDLGTRVARRIGTLSTAFNGLSFVPAGTLDPTKDVLVGATSADGSFFRIDTGTAATTRIGAFGGGLVCSGDLVAVRQDALYATARPAVDGGADVLVTIAPSTGVATRVGTGVGINRLWGLASWAGTIVGFTQPGQVVTINRQTGVGTVISTSSTEFWGAAVTTTAPSQ